MSNSVSNDNKKPIYIERFDAYSRFLHLMVIVSFLSLAFTGMVIKFSGIWFFQKLSDLVGGYQVTGFIHRLAAIITFAYFGLHLIQLIKKIRLEKRLSSRIFAREKLGAVGKFSNKWSAQNYQFSIRLNNISYNRFWYQNAFVRSDNAIWFPNDAAEYNITVLIHR